MAAETGRSLFSIADLEEGEHTIKIVNKEPLSGTAKKISYDYFEVKSSSASSTQTQELDLNPGNASETGIQYTGGWGYLGSYKGYGKRCWLAEQR